MRVWFNLLLAAVSQTTSSPASDTLRLCSLASIPGTHNEQVMWLTLPPLEAAGFLLHRERPAVAGLTLAPQAFILSVCPTARRILIPSSLMFFAAL